MQSGLSFKIFDLGLVDYKAALEYQHNIFSNVKSGVLKSALIICRHSPVITLGRQADKNNIIADETMLRNKGVGICGIERGGDVTYHGPGQITAYPVFNLCFLKKDIHLFLRQLEQTVIDLLSDFGIIAVRKDGLSGVWSGERKISSVGISIRNWISFHGISINIKDDDLPNYRLIRPCGMDIEMTSLETILNRKIEIDALKPLWIEKFVNIFSNKKEDAVLV